MTISNFIDNELKLSLDEVFNDINSYMFKKLHVTDMEKIMEYGVMSMPALVVNEKVVSMGKVLKATDVEKLLHKLGF